MGRSRWIQFSVILLVIGAWVGQSFLLLLITLYYLSVIILQSKKHIGFELLAIFFLTTVLLETTFTLWSVSAASNVTFSADSTYTKNYFIQIPEQGYKIRPGTYKSHKIAPDGSTIYDVTYSIGLNGYRGTISDQANINLFGGSFTFGEGLDYEGTLAGQLAGLLETKVNNFGIHGYGVHQALFISSNEPLSQSAQTNILLTSPFHALRSSCKPSYAKGTPRYRLLADYTVVINGVCPGRSLIEKIIFKSHFFNFARSILKKTNEITDYDIELYLALIKQFSRDIEASGRCAVVAYIDQDEKDLQNTEYDNARIKTYFKSNDIRFIDVTLRLHKQNDTELSMVLSKYDRHPTAEANQNRAKIIYDRLNENVCGKLNL